MAMTTKYAIFERFTPEALEVMASTPYGQDRRTAHGECVLAVGLNAMGLKPYNGGTFNMPSNFAVAEALTGDRESPLYWVIGLEAERLIVDWDICKVPLSRLRVALGLETAS